MSLFVAGAAFGDVGVSSFVADAVFGEVAVSLLVAGSAFCKIWNDSRVAKCFLAFKMHVLSAKSNLSGRAGQICRAVFGEVDVILVPLFVADLWCVYACVCRVCVCLCLCTMPVNKHT